MTDTKLKKTTPTAIPSDSKPYWEYFGKDKAGKFPVGSDDGYAEWKDYQETPSFKAIEIVESIMIWQGVKENYLTYFTQGG